MKIIILGAAGNLGSQLYKSLVDDHEVAAFDRNDFDALDQQALFTNLQAFKPDIVVNCVAFNAVDRAEDKDGYQEALALNRDLPAHLAALALEFDFVLVHFSTDYVFSGLESKQSFAENDTPNPINKYGESKFLGEIEIKRLASRGLQYYIIRTSKLFGPPGNSLDAKPSFFDIMLRLTQDKKELTVVSEELSCFTYTPDLAAVSTRLMIARPASGIYHLINEGPATWHDGARELFALTCQKVALRPIRSENLSRPARRPKFSVLQNNKVKHLRPYQEALKDYLRGR